MYRCRKKRRFFVQIAKTGFLRSGRFSGKIRFAGPNLRVNFFYPYSHGYKIQGISAPDTPEIGHIQVYGKTNCVNLIYRQRAAEGGPGTKKNLLKTPIFPRGNQPEREEECSDFFRIRGFLTFWRVYVIIFAYKIRDESPILHYFCASSALFGRQKRFRCRPVRAADGDSTYLLYRVSFCVSPTAQKTRELMVRRFRVSPVIAESKTSRRKVL